MAHLHEAQSRRLGASAHGAAVLVRVAAFLIAAASVVVIPGTLAAAAGGHISHAVAFATAGTAAALTLLATLAARRLDPLRG